MVRTVVACVCFALLAQIELNAQEDLIEPNANWKFLRGLAEPTPNADGEPTKLWAELHFDDARWEIGEAGIGFGDDDDRTVLDDMSENYGAVYARRAFEFREDQLAGLRSGELQLVLGIDYDDGFAAYWNGHEIARAGVEGEPPPVDARAPQHEAGQPEDFPVPQHIVDALVDQGLFGTESVLAVQGHNSSLASGDFSLHPTLLIRETPPPPAFRVLVFSRTTGFRHSSISRGLGAIVSLAEEFGFAADSSERAADFNDANLALYDVVVFLNTTGNILNGDQESAFERFIQAGGGFVGVHSAADTEYDWPWYGELLGAYFKSHPRIQNATIHVEDRTHASTAHLSDEWLRRDEWYNFRSNPRDTVHVLARLDESSYSGGDMGNDHPIAWCHEFDGGRAWYTAGGHTSESYSEPSFRAHLLGGIQFAAGLAGACGEEAPAMQIPGDANQDGSHDISDAVWLLLTLFSEGRPFPCGDGTLADAANVSLLDHNGDDAVNLSDGIAMLSDLFASGPPHALGRECVAVESCEAVCQ